MCGLNLEASAAMKQQISVKKYCSIGIMKHTK